MKINLLPKASSPAYEERWIWAGYITLAILHIVLALPFANNLIVYEGVWLFFACAVMTAPCRRFYGDWSHLWIIPMVMVASTWLTILGIVIVAGPSRESMLAGLAWGFVITIPEILIALVVRWYVNWLEY